MRFPAVGSTLAHDAGVALSTRRRLRDTPRVESRGNDASTDALRRSDGLANRLVERVLRAARRRCGEVRRRLRCCRRSGLIAARCGCRRLRCRCRDRCGPRDRRDGWRPLPAPSPPRRPERVQAPEGQQGRSRGAEPPPELRGERPSRRWRLPPAGPDAQACVRASRHRRPPPPARGRSTSSATPRPPPLRDVGGSTVREAGGMDATAGGTVSFEMLDGVGGRWSVGRCGRCAGATAATGASAGRSFGIVAASFARSRSSCRVLSRVPMVLLPRGRAS